MATCPKPPPILGIWEDGSKEARAFGGDGLRRIFGRLRYVQTLANQQNIGDMFLVYINEASPELAAKWGDKWSEVPEKYACDQTIFGHLATYLVKEYISPQTSKNLEIASAKQLWSGLLQQNKKRFIKSKVETTKVRATVLPPPAAREMRAHA